MKSIKLRFYLVILLAMTSIMSVGFATWVATKDASTSIDGNIVVNDVLKVNDYITCTDVTNYKYVREGFVHNGYITNVGTIEANLNINIDNCILKFKEYDVIEIDFTLLSEQLSLFIGVFNSNKVDMSFSVDNNESGLEIIYDDPSDPLDDDTYNAKTYTSKFYLANYKDLSGTVTVKIKYTFVINDVGYYTEQVYSILQEDSFKYILSAKLTGSEAKK